MNSNLPFPLEEGWDYILTEDDRQKFAPKLETDEYWSPQEKRWVTVSCAIHFCSYNFYRRRKPSGWVQCVGSSLPDGTRSIWAFRASDGVSDILHGHRYCPKALPNSSYSHWRYCTDSYQIPPPPEKEKEEWEKAWESYKRSCITFPTSTQAAADAFKAGWNAKPKGDK